MVTVFLQQACKVSDYLSCCHKTAGLQTWQENGNWAVTACQFKTNRLDQAPLIQLVDSLTALLVQKNAGIIGECVLILAVNEWLTQKWRQSN